jgi:UTP--glucose-1-phosphate uridylyltransferase
MHVFTPIVFDLLEKQMQQEPTNILLTPALQELAQMEKYLALEMKGSRYDLSGRHGYLRAQVALGLAGEAHNETLTTLVELLAEANGRNFK